MNPHQLGGLTFRRVAMLTWLLVAVAGAVGPAGVLVLVRKNGDYSARLELTGGAEAFLWRQGRQIRGLVNQQEGTLRLKFPGTADAVELTLSPQGDAWTDQNQDRWVQREQLLKADPSWTPVRIRVVDQNQKSVDGFAYRYEIEGNHGDWDPLLVQSLRSKTGRIELLAPAECRIELKIEHPDCIRGYGTNAKLERKKGQETLTAKVERGREVTGKVVADFTGKPVTGAIVSPLIFTPPGLSRDRERSLVSGGDGVFKLRGVGMAFVVTHADYLTEEVYLEEKQAGAPREVRLKAGAMVRGTVRDAAGLALAGVEVSDGSGKSTVTIEDGGFVLRGLRKWSGDQWRLEFSKKGFNEQSFRGQELPPDGLDIQLVPLPELCGRVVMPDGTPAKKYRIACGPGANPPGYACVRLEVADEAGKFAVEPKSLPEGGSDYWIGVRAEGAAPWEGMVALAALSAGDFRIALKEGRTLTARLALPASVKGPAEVTLEAVDRQPEDHFLVTSHPGAELSRCVVALDQGGELRFPNLRAGSYRLDIRCEGTTPVSRLVTIGSENLDLGELRLGGTGSIFGVARQPHDPRTVWRFATGEICIAGIGADSDKAYLKFKTDAEGRFRVAGVPAGRVTVSFPYFATADIMESMTREAWVVEGKETEIRFEGIGGAWTQPLRLLFDGSEVVPAYAGARKVENVTTRAPMFRFEVSPLGTGPVSGMGSTEWSADEKAGPAIPDLAPGRWRIRVYDWLGSRGFDEGLRAATIAEVGAQRQPVTVELGGKTLCGQVTAPRKTRRYIRIVAVGKSCGRVFLSHGDGDGNFVVRHLPEDEYLVHAHDDDGGWCDLGTHRLNQVVVDCGVHGLSEGGHVAGKLDCGLQTGREQVDLSAVGPGGVEIPVDELREDGSYRFGNLMPGKWTIIARLDDRELARHPVEVLKGQTAEAQRVGK